MAATLLGPGATAQDLGAVPPAAGEAPDERERLGLLRAGPFYITPQLRIGTIGLDTNVFYTASDRRTDFLASGGPGLEIALPIRRALVLTTSGGVEYLYFARTEEQRRFTGDGQARLEWAGIRAGLGVGGGYRRTFGRPNLEVDARVAEEQRFGGADLRLHAGERLEFGVAGSFTRHQVEGGQQFFGADLRRNLTRDVTRVVFTPSYRLTPKTSFLVEADAERAVFPLAPERDSDSNRVGAGFELLSRTRLAGRAVAGVRSFRLRNGDTTNAPLAGYANVDLTYHFGPRTRLLAGYGRDLQYSAFATGGRTPTITVQSYRTGLELGLGGRLDLRLAATYSRLRSDGAVRIERPGEVVTALRDDRAWQGVADLGYTFRSHLRIGVAASYTERRSTIADLGIEGLLVGGTITYEP